MLTALTQGWGVGALLPTFGAGPEAWEQPVATAKRLASQGRTRDRVAQALGTLADRWPRIGAVGRKVLGGLLHLHGRHKDRRRGGASS
jgi:acyl-CoA synthetase (AMP-forming)/AMP-acid ligase II